MISTPNGIMIAIIFKGGLPYTKHYYPTNAQMRDITREEIMTLPGEWNPSLLDDSPNASDLRLRQFPPTSIDATVNFYNIEGNIIVQKRDVDDSSISSNVLNTSSGSRRCSYQARSRKVKEKKHHGPKGKKIKWSDDSK